MADYSNGRTVTLSITHGQMAGLISLFDPIIDNFVERVAQRVKQLEEEKAPRFYSRREAAELLHVTLPTLHAMVNAGALHPKKVGGRVLFEAQPVDEAIKNGTLRKSIWNKKGGRYGQS